MNVPSIFPIGGFNPIVLGIGEASLKQCGKQRHGMAIASGMGWSLLESGE